MKKIGTVMLFYGVLFAIAYRKEIKQTIKDIKLKYEPIHYEVVK